MARTAVSIPATHTLPWQAQPTSDGTRNGRWGYRCRTAGDASGRYTNDGGALLLCWWDPAELG